MKIVLGQSVMHIQNIASLAPEHGHRIYAIDQIALTPHLVDNLTGGFLYQR